MTKENRIRSERLMEIILWSIEFRDLWYGLVEPDPHYGITELLAFRLFDQVNHHGFMEIHYILLTKIASMTCSHLMYPDKFVLYLKASMDSDFELDYERIEQAISKAAASKDANA